MERESRGVDYAHILKYTSLFGGVQGLNILIGLVRNKLVALLLGPDGMGLVSLFNATVRFVSDSTNLGLPMAAVRELSLSYEQGDEERVRHSIQVIRSLVFATALLGMFLCALLCEPLDRFTFSWGNHALHFVLLSPIVSMVAISGGELAILKATRQLRKVAMASVLGSVGALIFSIPIYYRWGQAGIVPSLVLIALVQMLLTGFYSFRLYPLKIIGFGVGKLRVLWREGTPMVRLGIGFVCAGILGSGADFLIRSLISHEGSLEDVGLFNMGYMMTMTYAGMVFSAMETDYFPRLSACCQDIGRMNTTINKQVEVSMLLISPMLAVFLIGLPLLIPLLLTKDFMASIGMIQLMLLAIYLRGVKLPMAYLPLAKGDSKSYLLMEGIYAIVVVILVLVCYRIYGITGSGLGYLLAAGFDFLMLCSYMHFKYHYRMSRRMLLFSGAQLLLGVATFFAVHFFSGFSYWMAGTGLVLGSSLLSGMHYKHLRSLS